MRATAAFYSLGACGKDFLPRIGLANSCRDEIIYSYFIFGDLSSSSTERLAEGDSGDQVSE
jgi:hypothetical protein